MDAAPPLPGPNFGTAGLILTDLTKGAPIRGHAHGEPVLLVRRGDELLTVGARSTHFGAPLETGPLVGDTVRCPWYHACFSLRTGEALQASAFDPLAPLLPATAAPTDHPKTIVIVGGMRQRHRRDAAPRRLPEPPDAPRRGSGGARRPDKSF